MALTNIKGGIFAVPNVGGSGRLMDLWNSENIYFVDAKNGSAGNPGKEPETSKALPSEAISACSGGASIYIRPAGVLNDQTTSVYQYYTDDIIIPYAKSGIALIGAGNSPIGWGGALLRPTSDDSCIQVRSNGNLITNLHVTLNAVTDGTSAACIELTRSGSTSRPYGNVIRDCRFSGDVNYAGTTGENPIGAIYNATAQNLIIEDCLFDQCRMGIGMFARVGDVINCIVRRNIFAGNPAYTDCCIVIDINSAGSYGNMIYDNIFGDGLPAAASGNVKRFIYFHSQAAGSGILANNYFACKDGTFRENGSQGITSDTFFFCGNYQEGTAANFVFND